MRPKSVSVSRHILREMMWEPLDCPLGFPFCLALSSKVSRGSRSKNQASSKLWGFLSDISGILSGTRLTHNFQKVVFSFFFLFLLHGADKLSSTRVDLVNHGDYLNFKDGLNVLLLYDWAIDMCNKTKLYEQSFEAKQEIFQAACDESFFCELAAKGTLFQQNL